MSEQRMTEDQRRKMLAVLIEHGLDFNGLTKEEAQWVIYNTRAAIDLAASAIKAEYARLRTLINWIDIVTIPATTEEFVAKDEFQLNSEEVKFHGFYGTFEEDFLKGDGKIEKPTGEQVLRYGDLLQNARHLPQKEGQLAIIPELGGEDKAETTLGGMYGQLKKQGHGQKKGALLTDGRANIFYIRNQCGVLRAVHAYWSGSGWNVRADSVENPYAWYAGGRVFSGNS